MDRWQHVLDPLVSCNAWSLCSAYDKEDTIEVWALASQVCKAGQGHRGASAAVWRALRPGKHVSSAQNSTLHSFKKAADRHSAGGVLCMRTMYLTAAAYWVV